MALGNIQAMRKMLGGLKEHFSADEKGLEAISYLELKLGEIDKLRDSMVIDVSQTEFPLPPDVQGETECFLLFSDGACRGNPGPGAYGLLIQNAHGDILAKASGVEVPTTNNKMEMKGVIEGLKFLIQKFIDEGHSESHIPVIIYSDSKYVIEGLTSWMAGWKKRGWKKADNKAPENLELWQELDMLTTNFKKIRYQWVKGHAGHPQNEFCDKLANEALDQSGL